MIMEWHRVDRMADNHATGFKRPPSNLRDPLSTMHLEEGKSWNYSDSFYGWLTVANVAISDHLFALSIIIIAVVVVLIVFGRPSFHIHKECGVLFFFGFLPLVTGIVCRHFLTGNGRQLLILAAPIARIHVHVSSKRRRWHRRGVTVIQQCFGHRTVMLLEGRTRARDSSTAQRGVATSVVRALCPLDGVDPLPAPIDFPLSPRAFLLLKPFQSGISLVVQLLLLGLSLLLDVINLLLLHCVHLCLHSILCLFSLLFERLDLRLLLFASRFDHFQHHVVAGFDFLELFKFEAGDFFVETVRLRLHMQCQDGRQCLD